MIKIGSDFSGVGAFNQALMRLGIEYEEVFACDMDKYARQTFIHNYGEPKYYPTNVYEREIPKESLDIYMTSPPCQAFSLAGKRLGKNDQRGILFFNSLEFIQINKPRYFIFENVKGLLSDDNGKTFREWVNLLGGKSINGNEVIFTYEGSVPYHLYWQVLNAKNHGVPQNRERIFLIGIRDDSDNNFQFPKEEHLTKRLKDVLENEVDEKYFLSEKMLNLITFEEKLNGEVANLNKGGERGSVYDSNCNAMSCLSATDYKQPKQILIKSATSKGYEKKKQMLTHKYQKEIQQSIQQDVSTGIDASYFKGFGVRQGKCRQVVSDSYKIRRLTPRECFRLMDFPDTFTWNVSDSQAYKQAGNSIVVNLLSKIIQKFKL